MRPHVPPLSRCAVSGVATRAAATLRWRVAAPLPLRAPPPRPPPPATRLLPGGPAAHYRFPHPVEKGTRLTGSKSKKVIRIWQAEVALEQSLRIRDEMLLLLALHPDGLLLDAVWPAMRRMVRSRPESYSPVNAGRMDKPDRTMVDILRTAGYETLKAFLLSLPEIALTGEAPRERVALVNPPAADAPPPPQPVAAAGPQAVVVRRTRIRDISAQLLGLGDWREQANVRGQERVEAREAALALLSEAERAALAAKQARAVEKERAPRPPKRREELFPDWRRVRPAAARGGGAARRRPADGPPRAGGEVGPASPRRPRPPPRPAREQRDN